MTEIVGSRGAIGTNGITNEYFFDKFGRLISPQFSIGQQALEARLSAGNSSPVLFYSSMSSNESLAFSSTPTADSSRNYRTLTRSTWRR